MTQLLMAYRKLDELVFYDKIKVSESIAALNLLFPQQQPILNDYF